MPLRILPLLALPLVFCACPGVLGDGGEGEGEGEGQAGEGEGEGQAGEGEGEGEGEGQAGFACTSGAVFAGDPSDTADIGTRPPDGTALLAHPPFPYRTIVFLNGHLITHDGQEIWQANLADGILHKVAGTESVGQALITGPCAGARFANIFHIALASDGSLFVSDQTANTILKITDPLGAGAGCSVAHYAGTPNDIPDDGTITPGSPPNTGHTDGPGDTAQFGLPEHMTLDGNDNIFVYDSGQDAAGDPDSIRKIASDANHTVSTVVSGIGDALISPLFLNGTVYVWGHSGNDIFLATVNPVAGTQADLFRGRADRFGGDSSDSEFTGGMVTDGTDLFLHFNGQIFQVTTAGAVHLPALAGVYHPGIDFSIGYDPAVAHSADTLEIPEGQGLVAVAGAQAFLAFDGGHDFYVSAIVDNNYVTKIDCAP